MSLLEWLSSPDNPPVRYPTARDLLDPAPLRTRLQDLRGAVAGWAPLQQVLDARGTLVGD